MNDCLNYSTCPNKAILDRHDSDIARLRDDVSALFKQGNDTNISLAELNKDIKYMRPVLEKMEVYIDEVKTRPSKNLNAIIVASVSSVLTALIGAVMLLILK